MSETRFINGFSRLSKEQKIATLSGQLSDAGIVNELKSYWHPISQKLFDEFSENTLTNYYLPFGLAPNFLIDGSIYHVPMVTEESSVVAAASAAAKFWSAHGGFHTEVISMEKTGQIHFTFGGGLNLLKEKWSVLHNLLLINAQLLTKRMETRGGGITSILLEDCTKDISDYFRLNVSFNTVDSMGANFINSVLENMAQTLHEFCHEFFPEHSFEVIMSILSNYAPNCTVKCYVEGPVSIFDGFTEKGSAHFVDKFYTAVRIAEVDVNRAVTHNKGIMNGIDAVVLATGNDFRAVEAGVHAFACRNGAYKSLSSVSVNNNNFRFAMEVPLAIGTVGGLTTSHPLAARAMQILGNPDAKQLMRIVAAAGLANHFSAVRALVTKGIQQGHMKMHLGNILNQLQASDEEIIVARDFFANQVVSFSSVRDFLEKRRK